ncbi:hypothetical protein SDC9_113407 [bioreactor metagenome]|uniref:Uncharacterized protein n=1 Tax=bioreactor metagenome TaxID=1076179 RepID=A0A645BLZ3_9ZZZZ
MDVEEHIPCADEITEHELAGIGLIEAGKLGWINRLVDVIGGVILVGGQDGHVILGEVIFHAGKLDIRGIPVVLILLKGGHIVDLVFSHLEGAHADIGGGVNGPGALGIGILSLHSVEGGECAQLKEVGGGRLQFDSQGAGCVVGDDVHRIRIAFDDVKEVTVVSAEVCGGSAVPGGNHFAGLKVASVRPLEAIAESKGVGQFVVAQFVGLGELR